MTGLNGVAERVGVPLCVSEQDVLPMYPGYALGNIIHKIDLVLPLLNQRRAEYDVMRRKVRDEIKYEKQSASYRALSAREQEITSSTLDLKKRIVTEQYCKVCEDIKNAKEAQQLKGVSINEMLPIDFARSESRIDNRSFPSESESHIVFHNNDKLREHVKTFVSELSLDNGMSPSFSKNKLNQISRQIDAMLTANQDVAVQLTGSFVTLSRVMTIDPIVIRDVDAISSELKKNAEQYYVLTEAILGGFFLGYGLCSEFEKTLSENQSYLKSSLSKISIFSFISQGAIPKVQDKNLWDTFKNWKQVLMDDIYSGYPIAFKVRKLSDVFNELGISMQEED